MIRNFIREVEEITLSILATRVPKDDDCRFAVSIFTETRIEVNEDGPAIVQLQKIGVYLIFDDDDNRMSTLFSMDIKIYNEELLREGLAKALDAFIIERMEHSMMKDR